LGPLGAPAPQRHSLVTGKMTPGARSCDADCDYPSYMALGDQAGPPGTRPDR
jgi:hypothetical protein